MSTSGLIAPIKSPARAGASQRSARRIFDKSNTWKERFREQCLQRITDIRQNAQRAQRLGLNDAKDQNGNFHPYGQNPGFDANHNDQENMDELGKEWIKQLMEDELSIFEAYADEDYLNHQLSAEDQDLLFEDLNGALYDELEEQEYQQAEEHLHKEEKELERTLSLLEEETSVPCPICRQDALVEDESSISCSCGMRQDRLLEHHNLENLYHNLTSMVAQHAENCDGTPEFFCEEVSFVSYLFVSCPTCSTVESVL